MLRLCAFDVETKHRLPEFVCGSIYSDETVGYYNDAGKMIEELRRHARKGYTLIAHHAEYDITTLLWPNGEDVTITYANSIYTSASWHFSDSRRTCPIWDNMRLCAGLSLEALGESIGIPKYPMPLSLKDSDDWRRDWVCETHGIPGCWECYCVRDSEIVWCYANALSEWLGAYGVRLHYSLARSAIDLWKLLDPDAQQSIRSKEVRAAGRMAYHGGRNEVFQYGNVGRVYTADFRLFYGSILRDIQLPDVSDLRYSSGDMGVLHSGESDGVVTATVFIDSQHIPPLPVSYRDRVYYPVGRATGSWPISELRRALEYGVKVESIDFMYWTDKLVNPFRTFASVLIERRESLRNAKDARELACKYMLNAVPGRLGMRESTERVTYRKWRGGHKGDTLDGAELERVGRDLFLAHRSTLHRPASTSNVVWAACITGEGRSRLNSVLASSPQSVLYCDTDSIHSREPIVCGSDLPGMLRDTGVFDTGIYLGAKFYSLETFDGLYDVRAKGIPRSYAVEFIKNRHVAYQTSMGVANGILRGVAPAVWVDVERVARAAPGTRTILNPAVISGEAQWSPTAPVVFGDVSGTVTRGML